MMISMKSNMVKMVKVDFKVRVMQITKLAEVEVGRFLEEVEEEEAGWHTHKVV